MLTGIVKRSTMKRKPESVKVRFERMFEVTGAENPSQFADIIGVTKQAVHQALKKNKIPGGWATQVSCITGCSLDWLVFGDTDPYQMKIEKLAELSKTSERLQKELREFFTE